MMAELVNGKRSELQVAVYDQNRGVCKSRGLELELTTN
jgi:hypothetical protein